MATSAKSKDNYVTMILPRIEGESDIMDVVVNGKFYQIRKGVQVAVPPEVAQVIANSFAQAAEAMTAQEKYQNVKIG